MAGVKVDKRLYLDWDKLPGKEGGRTASPES